MSSIANHFGWLAVWSIQTDWKQTRLETQMTDEYQADTELAPTARAYGQADDEPPMVEYHSWRNTLGRSGMILICCAVLAIVVGAALWVDHSSATSGAVTPSVQMPAESAAAPTPHLVYVPDAIVEDQDSRFVAIVTADGITGSKVAMLDNAHRTCMDVKAGAAWVDIVNSITEACPTVSAQQAGVFVQAAITTYCP